MTAPIRLRVTAAGPRALRGSVWVQAGPRDPSGRTVFCRRVSALPPWWRRWLGLGWGRCEMLDVAWLEEVRDDG